MRAKRKRKSFMIVWCVLPHFFSNMMTKFSFKAQMLAKFNFPCVFMFDFRSFFYSLLSLNWQHQTPIDRIIRRLMKAKKFYVFGVWTNFFVNRIKNTWYSYSLLSRIKILCQKETETGKRWTKLWFYFMWTDKA